MAATTIIVVGVAQVSSRTMTVVDPIPVLYNNVPEPVALKAAAALLPHSIGIHGCKSPTPAPAWADPEYTVRLAYVRCTEDQCLPVAKQDHLLNASGVAWDVHTLSCGHSRFLSCPANLVECLLSIFARLQA